MGIYIKGMGMPMNCYQCFDTEFSYVIGCYKWADMEYKSRYEGRAKDCPLTEVQEPHGRLIDADKLLGECRPRGIADDVWKASNEYKQIINAPTVMESEVEE